MDYILLNLEVCQHYSFEERVFTKTILTLLNINLRGWLSFSDSEKYKWLQSAMSARRIPSGSQPSVILF